MNLGFWCRFFFFSGETQISDLTTEDSEFRYLVGGFNPFEKYARQMGSFPQVGVNMKNI